MVGKYTTTQSHAHTFGSLSCGINDDRRRSPYNKYDKEFQNDGLVLSARVVVAHAVCHNAVHRTLVSFL